MCDKKLMHILIPHVRVQRLLYEVKALPRTGAKALAAKQRAARKKIHNDQVDENKKHMERQDSVVNGGG